MWTRALRECPITNPRPGGSLPTEFLEKWARTSEVTLVGAALGTALAL